MAKYDHGGGCACGLYKECVCREKETEMERQWTQEQITLWAWDTFGPASPAVVASRMNVEMAELLEALALNDRAEARKEVADVGIILLQLAELLDIDLMPAVSAKMEINTKRKWKRNPSGSFQHVEGS